MNAHTLPHKPRRQRGDLVRTEEIHRVLAVLREQGLDLARATSIDIRARYVNEERVVISLLERLSA